MTQGQILGNRPSTSILPENGPQPWVELLVSDWVKFLVTDQMPSFKEWPLNSGLSPLVLDWFHIVVSDQMSPFNRRVTQLKVESPNAGLVPYLGLGPDIPIQ